MAKSVTTTTTVREEHVVTRDDIIMLLRRKGVWVPDNADVIVPVPTGGDYSGMDLDIDRDTVVRVRFTETTTKHE